jgi:hypothetical protein
MEAPSSSNSSPFVGYISPWKVIGITVLISVLGISPLLPGFGRGLVYGAFFFTPLGYPFLVLLCSILILLALLQLPLIFRGIMSLPAIEINDGTVRIWGLKWREYPLGCVTACARRQFGSLTGRCPDGRPFTIPLWLYRDPQQVSARLMPATCSLDAAAAP